MSTAKSRSATTMSSSVIARFSLSKSLEIAQSMVSLKRKGANSPFPVTFENYNFS